MRIDFCIPAHNEAAIIHESIRILLSALSLVPHTTRIIVVSNGSSDDTAVRARASGATVIEVNESGKGGAVIAAARASDADFFGFVDADLSADPHDIPALCAVLEQGAYDVVVGSRLLDTDVVQRAGIRTLTSRIFNVLQRQLLGISVRDTQCGLKIMNAKGRAVLRECTETGWFFDLEFLARAQSQGLRVREMAVHWNEYRFPERTSKLSMIRDGFGAVRAMFRIRSRLKS